MSRMHFQEVKCVNCGHVGKFNVWDSINVDTDSKIKEEVKSLDFFKYTCPKCGNDFQVDYLTVYNDIKNHFMIYYVPKEDIEVVDKIKQISLSEKCEDKARIVFSKNDLLEKICVFEAMLNDVLIEKNAVILDGVTVGDGAVIGANSTVIHDVPPYAVVAGTPARIVKYRFSQEIIERLVEIKWWNLPPAMLNNLPYRIESALNTLEQRIKKQKN